jgi:anti-sigma regulatory factor (Ser/Thr protein kinase)
MDIGWTGAMAASLIAVCEAAGISPPHPVRRVTARWLVRASLPADRAEDFVIAVSEIAANAVRY